MTFFRYIAVQILAYCIDIGMFWLMLAISAVSSVWANVLAKLVAGFFAFFLHRCFTFSLDQSVFAKGQAIRYFVLLSLNIPFALAVFVLFLLWVPDPFVVKLIADVICVGLTYYLNKCFIFYQTKS